MEENTAMRDHLFEVIENQIENNDPPETKKLMKGYEPRVLMILLQSS